MSCAAEISRPNVFISYSWQCRPRAVHRLADYLEQRCNVWLIKFERREKRASQAFSEAIDFADFVIVCLSEAYKTRKACLDEFEYAKKRDKLILVVRMHDNLEVEGESADYFLEDDATKDEFQTTAVKIATSIFRLLSNHAEHVSSKRHLRIATSLANPYKFYERSADQFDDLSEKLAARCRNPKAGALLISGMRGVGKTAFVLQYLLKEANHYHLLNDCKLRSVFWLNCSSWRTPAGFNEDAKQSIRNQIMRLTSTKYRRIMSIADLTCYSPLFIFDDVFHTPLTDFIVKELCCVNKMPCCIITNDEFECYMTMSGSGIANTTVVGPLNEREIEGVFKNLLGVDLVKKLSTTQITGLVLSFSGLPKRAANCVTILRASTAKDLKLKINEIINQNRDSSTTVGVTPRHPKNKPTPQKQESEPSEEPKLVDEEFEPLVLVDVPDFTFQLYQRKWEEQALLNGIRNLAEKPTDGAMLVVGGSGYGKSTLVSSLLRNNRSISQCNFEIVLWLNCYQWHNEMTASDAESFSKALLKIGGRLVRSEVAEKWKDLANMVDYFVESKSQRILFVLDDVLHQSVLENFRKWCSSTPVLVITRYGDRFKECKEIATRHVVSLFSEDQLVEMFQTVLGLKDKLNENQLKQVAKRCLGSPLTASLVSGYFSTCKNYAVKFENLLEKVLGKLGKKRVVIEERQEKDAKELFRNQFSHLDDDMKARYFVMLLFDPIEQVKTCDLPRLWNISIPEALEVMQEFETLALATLTKLDRNTAILFHQILHEEAVLTALKSKEESHSELRLRIMAQIGGEWLAPEDSTKPIAVKIAAFFFKAVEADLGTMLASVVSRFPIGEFKELARQRIVEYSGEEIKLFGSESSKTSLEIAIEHGDVDLVDLLCKFLPKAMLANEKTGMTPLMLASKAGHQTLVEYFYGRQPQTITKKSELFGDTAMSLAVENQHWSIVEFLGDRLPAKSEATRDAIADAVLKGVGYGHLPTVIFFHEKCSNKPFLSEKDGFTIIRSAASKGYLPILEYFEGKWQDSVYLTRNEKGHSVVMDAVIASQIAVVRYLCQRFPQVFEEIDKEERTLFVLAGDSPTFQEGCDDPDKMTLPVVAYLYEKWPVGVDKRDKHGKIPLFYAAKRGYVATFNYLVTRTTNAVEAIKENAWELAKSLVDSLNVEMLKAICNAWPDFASVSGEQDETTILMLAAQSKQQENKVFPFVKFLLDTLRSQANENVCLRDLKGKTALIYAGMRGHCETFKLLLEKSKTGVDDIIKGHGWDLAVGISESGSLGVLERVFEEWPDIVRLSFDNSMTFLMLAIAKCPVICHDERRALLPIVKFLVEKWPEIVNQRDSGEMTALYYAAQRGCRLVYKFLKPLTNTAV